MSERSIYSRYRVLLGFSGGQSESEQTLLPNETQQRALFTCVSRIGMLGAIGWVVRWPQNQRGSVAPRLPEALACAASGNW